jgi:Ca2+-binding RTX toxin-like protein
MAMITGNANIDFLIGTSDVDSIRGLAGNDTLLGSGGDDILSGGTCNDVLLGGAADDTFLYTSGHGLDAFNGGVGTDQILTEAEGENVKLRTGVVVAARIEINDGINWVHDELASLIGGPGLPHPWRERDFRADGLVNEREEMVS